MIKIIVRSTAKVLSQQKVWGHFKLLSHSPKFHFSKETFLSVMEILQNGKASNDFDSLVKQIQTMEEEGPKIALLKTVLDRVKMSLESPSILQNQAFKKAIAKYYLLCLQVIQIRLLHLQKQVQSIENERELQTEQKRSFLIESGNILSQWNEIIYSITNVGELFQQRMNMSKTNNFLFINYVFRYMAEGKRVQATQKNCQYNEQISVMMREYFDQMKKQYLQLKNRNNLENDELNLLLKQKISLFQNTEAFAFNLLCANWGRQFIFSVNNDKALLKQHQLQYLKDMTFILQLFQTIGFEDINFTSSNYIQLLNTANLISMTYDQRYEDLLSRAGISEKEFTQETALIENQFKKVVEAVKVFLSEIQNKQSNLSKWSELGEMFVVIQIDWIAKKQSKEIRTVIDELIESFLEGIEKEEVKNEMIAKIWERLQENMKIAQLMNHK